MREAVAALQEHGDAARLYAGGTELLLVMKQKIAQFDYLIDVKRIPELSTISAANGHLRVGALCTHLEVERSQVVRTQLPFLCEVESEVANIRVRNVGTIGGNLYFAEPHSDLGLVSVLLNATMNVAGPGGARTVPAGELFLGPYATTVEPTEVMTAVDFPLLPAGAGTAYLRFRFHERPSVAVGAILSPAADGRTIAEARIGIGCAGPVPVRIPAAESLIQGALAESLLGSGGAPESAGTEAAGAVETMGDFSGSAEYKSHLISVLVARAVRTAASRMLGRDAHV